MAYHPEDAFKPRPSDPDRIYSEQEISDPSLNPEEALIAKQEQEMTDGDAPLDEVVAHGPASTHAGHSRDYDRDGSEYDDLIYNRDPKESKKSLAPRDKIEPHTHALTEEKFDRDAANQDAHARRQALFDNGWYVRPAQGYRGKEPRGKSAKGAPTIRKPKL